MVRLSALIVLAVASAGWLPAPDIESSRKGVDVEHYRFEITVTDESDEIMGTAYVSVRFTEDNITSFFLDLVGVGGDGKGMTVVSVTSDGQPVTFAHERRRLTLSGLSANKGDQQTFIVVYRGEPADGLVISENQYGSRTFFGDNWPNRARNWLPTVDHPADKALVDWIVTAPDHYQVIGNGRLAERSSTGDGNTMTHWQSTAAIPTKIMVIGIARFAVQLVANVDGIPLHTWVYPEDRSKGFRDFAVAEPMLRYFIDNIGEYPYAKLANVQSTTRYGGMENASAIFYDERAVTGNRTNEDVVAHEVAHQWFGNSATEGDWHHIWLSEGFANYFANLYYEHAYGRASMNARLREEREIVLRYFKERPDSPVIDLSITDLDRLLNTNVYEKGGWVLHMLRGEIGTENFWVGIRSYYAKFRNGNATTDDFQFEMEQASGRDLTQFFRQWIYETGHPEIEVEWQVRDDGMVHVQVQQKQEESFVFLLDIGVTLATGESRVERVSVTDRDQSFEITVNGSAVGLTLDPNVELLYSGQITRSE